MRKPDVTVPDTAPPSELVVTDDIVGDGDEVAIGHIAGHKNATTTALYVHNSEAAARRAVARRAGILDTDVDTGAGQAAEKRPVVRPKFSESLGGPSWTRTRSQWIKNPLLYHLS